SEIVILLAFEVNSTNASGLVSLCYPFFTLESILPRLGQQTYVRQSRQNKEETIRANRQRIQQTYMPVHAELGRGQLSVGQARKVQVGDVLTLQTQTDEPVVLFVGEEPKYLGVPFTGPHGKTTVKISEVIHPQDEELYVNRSCPVPCRVKG
ncbi:MAG: hypothetical protein HOH74_08255, partial [Gemmatimonadetes bacterium]|nr:hypothetical protein [Gemmatimonadota bacterium]